MYKVTPASDVERLTQIRVHTKNDTLRMAVCRDLLNFYWESNDDSSRFYCELLLRIARKYDFKLWQAYGLYGMAYVYRTESNYAKALQSYTEGQLVAEDPLSEKNIPYLNYFTSNGDAHYGRYVMLSNILDDFAGLFSTVGDSTRCFSYEEKAIKIAESIGDSITLSLIYTHLAQKYRVIKNPETSYQLASRSLQYVKETPFIYKSRAFLELAYYWFSKERFDSVYWYYQRAIESDREQNMLNLLASSYGAMSGFHFKQNNFDSTLYYSKKSLEAALLTRSAGSIQPAYARMSFTYSALNQFDSSLWYLRKSHKIKDSLQEAKNKNLTKYMTLELDQQLKLEQLQKARIESRNRYRTYAFISGLIVLVIIGFLLYRNNRLKHRTNIQLENSLSTLKATQAQLIQSEKMASLGELTAGIAHEIQNPLNFVNNFSEVNKELVDELQQELRAGKVDAAIAVSDDIKTNEEKISHHGKRADAIVKSMLQHSRTGTGKKDPTDINALAEEYLRLSYQGIRAKDPGFSADIQTDFDPEMDRVDLVPQDIGRVLLNLFNNAFYTVAEKSKRKNNNYKPFVNVKTRREQNKLVLSVKDNGDGIADKVVDKIFQPFFTTKTTGQGTGLGLSLAYDIIKAHGGDLKVKTTEGEGSIFTIQLPLR
jgi:two-component system, NtrC family, sensor kinase